MTDQPQIRFDDGAAYENYMGVWSRKVGEQFLDWLRPRPGLSWIDVGCGNGAFTALLAERVEPSSILGVDPSPAQLDYARGRPGVSIARFEQGHALALPAPDASVDAVAMALVLAFVPDPPKGLAEIRRVLRPGGIAAAYMWDLPGGGFPFHASHEVIEAKGVAPALPPSPDASRRERMEELWRGAGFEDVETRVIAVERQFPDFETLWSVVLTAPRLATAAASMPPELKAEIARDLKHRLGAEEGRPVTLTARANAVKGRAPG